MATDFLRKSAIKSTVASVKALGRVLGPVVIGFLIAATNAVKASFPIVVAPSRVTVLGVLGLQKPTSLWHSRLSKVSGLSVSFLDLTRSCLHHFLNCHVSSELEPAYLLLDYLFTLAVS